MRGSKRIAAGREVVPNRSSAGSDHNVSTERAFGREWWKGFASALVLVAATGWIKTYKATLFIWDATASLEASARTSKDTLLEIGLEEFPEEQPDEPSKERPITKGKPSIFPPLPRLVEIGLNGKPSHIRGGVDVSWLLDFAVLGFPKCGTTTLMQSLNTPYDAAVAQDERCALGNNNPARLVWQLLEGDGLPKDPNIRRGIKCPKDLESVDTLKNLAEFFPKTKLIITVRHPVLWFQSFYNFRARNIFPRRMPPAERLIGGLAVCRRGHNVCTDRANFHRFLARLGKTPLSSKEELQLLPPGWNQKEVFRLESELFLIHVSQMGDKNSTRLDQFRQDLQSFAGLHGEIQLKNGKVAAEVNVTPQVQRNMIDICSTEHESLRQVLMKQAKKASIWIIDYLLKSPDVVVSSRKHFIDLVRQWKIDPCEQDSRHLRTLKSNEMIHSYANATEARQFIK